MKTQKPKSAAKTPATDALPAASPAASSNDGTFEDPSQFTAHIRKEFLTKSSGYKVVFRNQQVKDGQCLLQSKNGYGLWCKRFENADREATGGAFEEPRSAVYFRWALFRMCRAWAHGPGDLDPQKRRRRIHWDRLVFWIAAKPPAPPSK